MPDRRSLAILTLVVAAALAAGITVHSQEAPAAEPAQKDCSLNYSNFGKAFVEKYCLRCHTAQKHNFFTRRGAPKGADFDAYAGIKDKAEKIKKLVVATHKMPKGKPKPDADERRQVGAWIDCGLPE